MEILTVRFSYLRNEAHYQFLLLVKKLFESYPSVASIVNTLLPQFYSLLALEGTLIDTIQLSFYTRQLVETDRRLDRAIDGLEIAIRAELHHPDPAHVKAAERLDVLLKAFRGEIERKPYEEEAAAVKILIVDLQTAFASDVSLLNFSVWVNEISAAQAAFEQIFLQRDLERANLPAERIRDVRRDIEAAYRQIIERIGAYTVMNGTTTTGMFIKLLNEKVVYFNEHAHHRVRKDIARATVDSIANQTWENKPLTPMPTAMYEGHELVFAYDYDLAYHNNDRPGNATVTLLGKGAWKGKKTVGFLIVAPEKA
jgi:hypothetical protein